MNDQIKIYFLENSFNYNALDLNSSEIAGSEKTLINISNELAKDSKFIIKVFNNTTKPQKINNVYWQNLNQIDLSDKPDYVIAMSDSNLFKRLNCNKNFLWSHSIQTFEKFIRKKQLLSFIKYKPLMILEGEYHFKKRSFATSFFGKKILKIAADYDFTNAKIDIDTIPPPNAIFTTKSDRNLNFLINAWFEIKKKNPESNLFINPPHLLTDIEKKNGIIVRNKVKKNLLIQELKNSKLFIAPGHKTEVFCLAAEEAKELCLPIVTLGIGCLYERVVHGKTGFIAKNQKEFVNYTNLILNDDKVYITLRQNLYDLKNSRNYSHVKKDLIKILTNVD